MYASRYYSHLLVCWKSVGRFRGTDKNENNETPTTDIVGTGSPSP